MLKYLCVVSAVFIGAAALAEPPSRNMLISLTDECQCQTTGVCTCDQCECGNNQLISLVDEKPAVRFDFADLKKLPKNLGYGMPNTRAPIPDSFGTLVALNDQAGNGPPATRKISPADSPATLQSASPQIQTVQYRRVYIAMSCGPNGCQPQYRWEPIRVTPVSYTPPAAVYPTYDSIGGTAPPAQSYGYSYGCAGQSGYGCSGSSAGCAGARGVGPLRRLFGRR